MNRTHTKKDLPADKRPQGKKPEPETALADSVKKEPATISTDDDDLSMYTEKTRLKIIKRRKKSWENQKRTAGKKENKKVYHSVLDTYPVRDYRFALHGGYFILDDGSVFDILHITGQSYLHATADDLQRLANNNTIFHRMCNCDFNLYMFSVPTNARKHIEHIEHVSQKTTNVVHLQMLEDEIETCLWLENNKPEKQFFYAVFAPTPEQLLKEKQKFMAYSVVPLSDMSYSLKKMFLYKLNNPNSVVRF